NPLSQSFFRNRLIAPACILAQISKADLEVNQFMIFGRRELGWRQPHFMQNLPEAISSTGVISFCICGFGAKSSATKDHTKTRSQEVFDEIPTLCCKCPPCR